MATTSPSSSTSERKTARFPPQRGKIKAQIFEGLVTSVVSTVSKAGEYVRNIVIGNNGGNDGGDGSSGSVASSSSTPSPPSAYNSEGNTDDVS